MYYCRVVHFEVAVTRPGSIGAVYVVQVAANRFGAVPYVDVLQQPISQRARAVRKNITRAITQPLAVHIQ